MISTLMFVPLREFVLLDPFTIAEMHESEETEGSHVPS